MASLGPNFSSPTLLVFSLVSVLFLFMIRSSTVEAISNDEIVKVCFTTADPSLCVSVLKSIPGIASADLLGVETSVINLALNNATDTSNFISSLLEHATEDDEKDEFSKCKDSYEFITDDLNTAIGSLGSHDYRDVSVMAGAMTDQIKYCQSVAKSLAVILAVTERNKTLGYLVDIVLVVSNLLMSSS